MGDPEHVAAHDQRQRRTWWRGSSSVPPSLAATSGYRPGQFVTVRVPSDRCGSVARVHAERFVSLAENPFEVAAVPEDGQPAALSATLDGVTTLLPWPGGVRMLDVLIEAGLDAPYSCRQGICGACASQLTGGQVEMAHNEVLEAADVADGCILACQALALTPDVYITY
jgi:3-ketosteroid 9alpha-monooxygenase subunit B